MGRLVRRQSVAKRAVEKGVAINRLPFFAKVDQHGKTAIDGLSFDVMNEEALYASAAGNPGGFIFGLYAYLRTRRVREQSHGELSSIHRPF